MFIDITNGSATINNTVFRKDILWFICDVELKKGDLVRTGITNPLFGFKGGGVQFDTYVNSGYVGIFSNERMLPQ